MVVPNRVLRVALAIGALLATMLLTDLGTGAAAADPDDPGGPDTTSEPPTGEPEPTPTTPIPDLPNTIAGVLNDLLHKPLSIFGNGRVPGQPLKPVVVNPNGTTTPTKDRRRDDPTTESDQPEVRPKPDPTRVVPPPRPSSSFRVVLPFSPPVSIPIPAVPVPGYENMRLTLDLTDPYKAMASVLETTNTINSLLSDAYAPYDPFRPPPPKPGPTFKILQEEPVVEASGGNANRGTAVAESAGDLPVLQAPAMAPPVRIVLPRPAAGEAQVLGTGTVDMRGPAPRGSTGQTGSTEGANPSASAMGRPATREGYQQYLRTARTGQVATIAVPGLMGLLALTASGIVTGYRQANSQRFVRAEAARFL
jgi:hypothetical protein